MKQKWAHIKIFLVCFSHLVKHNSSLRARSTKRFKYLKLWAQSLSLMFICTNQSLFCHIILELLMCLPVNTITTILTNLNATSFLTEKNSDKAFSSSLSPPRHSLVFEEVWFWSTKCLSMKTLLRKPTKDRGEAFPLMRLSYCIQVIICKVRPKQVSQPHDYYPHAGQI